MASNLEAQIDDYRKRLIALDKKRARLVNELFRDIATLAKTQTDFHGGEIEEIGRTPLKVSRNWASILKRLSGFTSFNAGDVEIVVKALRSEEENEEKKMRVQRPGNIRSQLSLLTRKGILKRYGSGNYRVTAQAKKLFDLTGN
jgi:hypothetical protein